MVAKAKNPLWKFTFFRRRVAIALNGTVCTSLCAPNLLSRRYRLAAVLHFWAGICRFQKGLAAALQRVLNMLGD
jgi:hypothetical protein